MKNRLDKLLSIKSLVTLAMTAVFCTLALRQSISGQEFFDGVHHRHRLFQDPDHQERRQFLNSGKAANRIPQYP